MNMSIFLHSLRSFNLPFVPVVPAYRLFLHLASRLETFLARP